MPLHQAREETRVQQSVSDTEESNEKGRDRATIEHEKKKKKKMILKVNNKRDTEARSSQFELKELIQTLKRAAIRVEQQGGKKLSWKNLVGVSKSPVPYKLYQGFRWWRAQNEMLQDELYLLEPGRRAVRLHDLNWGYRKFSNLITEYEIRLEAMYRMFARAVRSQAAVELGPQHTPKKT